MLNFSDDIIIKYLDDNSSPEEELLLLNWLKESEENCTMFLSFKRVYNLKRIKQYSDPVYLNNALFKFDNRIKGIGQNYKRILVEKYIKYAAIFIFFVVTPFLFWILNRERPVELTSVNVGVHDSIKTVILPDGSKVWINNGSIFTYPVAFTEGERKVKIEGEAYFEVKTDSVHPFLVQTGVVTVRVCGTSFNVNAHAEDSTVETTLVQGKVILQNGQGKKMVGLNPGQLAVYNRKSRTIKVSNVNTDVFTSWRNGLFVFDNASITEIAKKIEDFYNVRITINIKNPIPNKYNFVFRQTQSLNTVLEMLKFVAPINYQIYDDQVYLNLKQNH